MLTNISSIDALRKEAKEIQAFLDITTGDDPVEIVERGNDLSVYISRTGKMLADAKMHLDIKRKCAIMEKLRGIGLKIDIPATTLNDLIRASCEEENYLVNWIERLNRTATHQLDWCRTLISKLKEEMKYS